MKKINFFTIIWLLFYVLIFSFLLHNSFNYLDPDLGWHLKVGEQILEKNAAPDIERYDYPLAGEKWVDHEWLFNAAVYWLYHNFGYLFLNLFFALIPTVTLILLNIFTQKYLRENVGHKYDHQQGEKKPKNRHGAMGLIMFFQFFGTLAMAPHLGVRMQEMALLNLLLLLIIIHQYSRRRNSGVLLWLLPLFCFWANIHASFLIGVLIMFFFAGIKIVEATTKKRSFFSFVDWQNSLTAKNIFLFFSFSLMAIAATFLTPYGAKLYNFLGGYVNPFYMKHIAEWLPAYYIPIQYKQLCYSAVVSAALILCVYFSFNRSNHEKNKENKEKIDLWYFALTLFFLLLAFKSKRHFPLFFIVSFPLLIKLSSEYLSLPFSATEVIKKNLLVKFYLLAGLALVIICLLAKTNYTSSPFTAPVFCRNFPCAAVDFLKNRPEYNGLNIFNKYGWGGFMIWTWPEKKLFIDGRLPQYKFAGHTLLEEYYEFFAEGKAGDKLNQYNIRLVLLEKDKKIKLNWLEKYVLGLNEDKINEQKNYLKKYLQHAQNWELVYNDNVSDVYVR